MCHAFTYAHVHDVTAFTPSVCVLRSSDCETGSASARGLRLSTAIARESHDGGSRNDHHGDDAERKAGTRIQAGTYDPLSAAVLPAAVTHYQPCERPLS